MRVLYLNHNVVGSGTYFRAFHLGRQLATRGHQVTLVTTSRSARVGMHSYVRDGLEVLEAPDLWPGRVRTGWDPYNTVRRIAALRARTFDVVHAFDSRPAVIYPALAISRRTGAPLFMDWADWWGRGGWINERSGWLVRSCFGPIETWFEEAYRRRAVGLTAISSALRDRTIALGIAPEKVVRVQQGCDPELVQPRNRDGARARLSIGRDSRLVLHVGVLTPGDHAFLRAAFDQVRVRTPNVKLVLAGRTGMRVRSSGDDTIVTGPLEWETLQDWLGAADVCVVPARDTIGNRGRWPSKLNDYLAAGRAVVMPLVGDAGSAVAAHRAGWTTEPTVRGFADGMADALQDADARAAAEQAARRMAESELAWPRIADELMTFYRSAGVRA